MRIKKTLRTPEERATIATEILGKLQELNLVTEGASTSPGIQEFLGILEQYQKPNILSGFSGAIQLPEFKRKLEYILPLRKTAQHMVCLKSTDASTHPSRGTHP